MHIVGVPANVYGIRLGKFGFLQGTHTQVKVDSTLISLRALLHNWFFGACGPDHH